MILKENRENKDEKSLVKAYKKHITQYTIFFYITQYT